MTARRELKKRLFFLKRFLHKPADTGAVTPSSRFLCEKMTDVLGASPLHYVVELGAGDGRITRSILQKVPPDCSVLAVEMQPDFVKALQRIHDDRLIVINDTAENLPGHLRRLGIQQVDCIISGLPLAALNRESEERILENVCHCLKKGGKYLQYHYFIPYNLRAYRRRFCDLKLRFTLLNIPPSFIYVCQK